MFGSIHSSLHSRVTRTRLLVVDCVQQPSAAAAITILAYQHFQLFYVYGATGPVAMVTDPHLHTVLGALAEDFVEPRQLGVDTADWLQSIALRAIPEKVERVELVA